MAANWKYGLAVSIPDKKGKLGSENCFLLSSKKITLGRAEENAIQLKNDAVSSAHCELSRSANGSYTITDLGSTNGTIFNGDDLERGDSRELRNGDVLVIGLYVTARFIRLKEIGDPGKKGQNGNAIGAVTQKLAKTPAIPRINPVAAAMAKAGKTGE